MMLQKLSDEPPEPPRRRALHMVLADQQTSTLHTLKLPRTRSSVSSQLVCVQRLTHHQDLENGPFWFHTRWSDA
jgi:hypothetical protein